MSTSLDIALAYLRRGWSVIPVPHGQKKPVIGEWQKLRITEETATQYFNGKPSNLGVLLGEPSGWLVDVDLDHMLAVELAPQFLPSTSLVFGRESKPRSHWLFRVSSPIKTKKINSKAHGMIVELRSSGLQTVLPPSIHVGGERIVWDDEHAEPAVIDPEVLLAAVVSLGNHVKAELGETVKKSKPKPKAKTVAEPASDEVPPWVEGPKQPDTEQRVKRCLAAMHRIQAIDQNDGSSRLYTVACRIVEHDLDDAAAITTFRQYERAKPFPRYWSNDDVLTRIRDAEKACDRGAAFIAQLDETGFIALGTRDPESGRLVLSPKRTLPTAEAFVEEFHQHPDGRTIHNFGGQLWTWHGNRYVEFEEGAIKQRLMPWLHGALRYQYNPKTGESSLVNFEANPGSVNVALESVRNHTHLPSSTQQPSWLGWQTGRPEPQDLLPCRSGIFHLPTRQLFAPSPEFFCTYALDYDPAPHAPQPTQWLRFLHEVLGDDIEAWDLLQEWFGYCLTADTSQQKMLLIVGPKRSGKGTIARVLAALIGTANVCGPTTSSLAGPFGLQPLIGKTLAIVSDARFRGESVPTVVERLLCISGEDAVTIDRKYLESVTMKLLTRFVFLSNELPQLSDASAALIGRFLILRLTNSFYGREDRQLTKRLITELPGIFNWALEGREQLHQRGHFVMPTSVADTVGELEDLASPVGAFVRDHCEVGPGYRVAPSELFAIWSAWCLRSGATPGTIQRFGRDLGAAVAGVRCRKGDSTRFYDGIRLKGSQQ